MKRPKSKITFIFISLATIIVVFVVVVAFNTGIFRAFSSGPINQAGVGYGALSEDSYSNVSVGSSSPAGAARFVVNASSGASSYTIKVLSPAGASLFSVDNSGNVVTVGSLSANLFSGNLSGVVTSGNVSAGTFGSNTGGGNYAFPGNLSVGYSNTGYSISANTIGAYTSMYSYGRICTGNNSGTCDSANGVVLAGSGSNTYGNVYISGSGNTYFNGGSVGIGTISPTSLLTVNGNLELTNITTGKRGVFAAMADNDYWFVGGVPTASNAGALEISTGDDANEPIMVRQYSGSPLGGTAARTAYLLDASGNTSFPGSVRSYSGGFVFPDGTTQTTAYVNTGGNKNWNWSGQSGQPPWVWGGSDGTNMYVYNPSNFSVNYANSAGSLSNNNISQFNNDSGYVTSIASGFSHSLYTNGYDVLPDGLIIEWGVMSPSGCASFAKTFPNAILSATASTYGGTDRIAYITSYSTSNICISNNGSGVQATYMAIGD
jgi:hypothetical protein